MTEVLDWPLGEQPDMDKACVCGHAAFLHGSAGCLKQFLGCGCPAYHPDRGTDQ